MPADPVETDATGEDDIISGTLSLTFTPKITKGQDVRVFLDERVAVGAASHALAPNPIDDGDFPAATVEFDFAEVRRSTYLVRAQVDGAGSAPDLDTDPNSAGYLQITGPEVAIP